VNIRQALVSPSACLTFEYTIIIPQAAFERLFERNIFKKFQFGNSLFIFVLYTETMNKSWRLMKMSGTLFYANPKPKTAREIVEFLKMQGINAEVCKKAACL